MRSERAGSSSDRMGQRRPDGADTSGGPGGGPTDFEAFFEAEAPSLYRRLCLVSPSPQEAEEAMQDAFLKVWERWDRVAAMDRPDGYLYRTAFRLAYRRGRRSRLGLARERQAEAGRGETADANATESVAAGLRAATPRQRAALVLTELMGYSSEEAADILGIKAGTVRTLASQGRAAMRDELERPDA
jgi:RNA polymerase sigma-70 factor, ECF subfamily